MYRGVLRSALALALAGHATAQSFDRDDIAPECAAACSDIVTVADQCERDNDDQPNEDRLELDCICNSPGLDQQIPECEACQRQYYGRDDDYSEILTLLSSCSFSTISATGTTTGPATGYATTVITTTWTQTEDDGDLDVDSTTITSVYPTGSGASEVTTTTNGGGAAGSASSGASAASGAAGSAADSGTGAVGDAASSATDAAGSAASQSDNLAPAITAAPVLAMAGVAAAVFGL